MNQNIKRLLAQIEAKGPRSCSRKGCNNICDLNSDKHGNICEDCFDELVLTGSDTDISAFMETEKQDLYAARIKYGTLFGMDLGNF